MKKHLLLILVLTLLTSSTNSFSKNRKTKKKHPKQLFNVTYVYDNVVKDSNLCPLLRLGFISQFNITNSTIVRLNNLNSSISINPINTFNGLELGDEFTIAVEDSGFYSFINNYFSFIKGTKHRTFIYANKIRQVYAFDNNITCTDTANLNESIIKEISSDEFKKNPYDIIIYVPSIKNQRKSAQKEDIKITKIQNNCGQISNLKFLYDINDELYGTKEFNKGNKYQTLFSNHSDASYYFICDSICGANRFQLDYTELSSGIKKTEVYFLSDITNQEININGKLTKFNGKFTFKMPPQNINTDTEYDVVIYGEDTMNSIYRTSEKIKVQKVVFAKCPF
jgi:hypothetical protein